MKINQTSRGAHLHVTFVCVVHAAELYIMHISILQMVIRLIFKIFYAFMMNHFNTDIEYY